MHYLFLLITFLLLTVSSNTFPQKKPTRLKISPKQIVTPESIWYGTYLLKKKVGYAMFKLSRNKNKNYLSELVMTMKVVSAGQKFNIIIKEISEFDRKPPYALRKVLYTVKQNQFVKTIELKRTRAGFDVFITENKEKRTKKIPPIDYTLSDFMTPEIWFSQKPKVGDSLTAKSFDVEELKTSLETYSILSIKDVIVKGVKVTYYNAKVNSLELGDLGVFRADNKGMLLSMKIGGIFELRLEPKDLAQKTEYSTDLFVYGLVKIDKPLGDPIKIKELVIEATGEGASKLKNASYQTVTHNKNLNTYTIKIGVSHGTPFKATNKEIKKNLSSTGEYLTKHPKIKTLVKKVIGNAKTSKEKVKRLIAFVDQFIEDSYNVEPLTVLDILSVKKGDCSTHSLLFNTLARSAGIPTRQVTGLVYMDDESQTFGWHSWNEVVLDGYWVPVDPTFGEIEANATHIRFGHGFQGIVDFLSTIGKLSFKLSDVQYRVIIDN